jgi:hypothetical protein
VIAHELWLKRARRAAVEASRKTAMAIEDEAIAKSIKHGPTECNPQPDPDEDADVNDPNIYEDVDED